MSSSILTVTQETLERDVLHAGNAVLLDLWAPWCAPCRALAPTLEKLSAISGDQLQVAKLDVEQFPELMQKFRVRGIPTLLLFKDGEEIGREVGVKTLDQLTHWLGNNDIQMAAAPERPLDSPLFGAFYGDAELKQFLCSRVMAHAEQGEIATDRISTWEGTRGTLAAGFVHSIDRRVFERVTGMPISIAPALDFVKSFQSADVTALCSALRPNSDLSRVPVRLMKALVQQPSFDWPGLLSQSAEADVLRLDWVQLCDAYIEGRKLSDSDCDALLARAKALETHSDQAVRMIAKLVNALTPLPASTDEHGWAKAFSIASGLNFSVAQHFAGWSAADRATEIRRDQWFTERLNQTPDKKFTPEQLAAHRAQWEAENGEYQAKERVFFSDGIQGLRPVTFALQKDLLALLDSAPEFKPL